MDAFKTKINLSINLLSKDFQTNENQININNKKEKYSEKTSLLLFTLATICYGISNFQLKYINYLFRDTYDVYSFGLWRMLAFIFLIKQIINYKNIEIVPLVDMRKQTLLWLGVRTFGQFISLIFFMGSLENLRVGTANCFVSMNPAAVLIFSTIFLNEKFHWRYPIGIMICFSGVLIIISNELNTVNDINFNTDIDNISSIDKINTLISDEKDKENYAKTLMGIFWGCLNLVTIAMLSVSSKFLNKANVGQENQCYYIGISNAACFILFCILRLKLNFNLGFIFISASNSIIFLAATFLIILAFDGVDLNKTTPLNYNTIVVSTFLSCLFLGEPLYFTDFLGSMIILGYNIFNSMYPVKD